MTQNIFDEAMTYFKYDKIPSMKELNSKYRQLALKMHPDKNGGSAEATENYQNLLKYYKVIGEKILEEFTNANENTNEEEKDNMTIFKNFNWDQKNTLSHTIFLENDRVPAWRKVLTGKCGEPEDLASHGLKFQVPNFTVNEESVTITVTLYETTKKLHIQSSSQFANDMFILHELSEYYAEVRKVTPVCLTDVGAGAFIFGAGAGGAAGSGRNLRARQGKSVKNIKTVNHCNKQSTAQKIKSQVKEQRIDAHKKQFDVQRNLPIESHVVDTEMEEVHEDEGDPPTTVTPPTLSLDAATFQNIDDHKKENMNLKSLLNEKENLIMELQEKIKELEKIKKNYEKDIKKFEADITNARNECDGAIGKASELCEENTLLVEQVKTYKNIENANAEIQEAYEKLVNVEKVTQGVQTDKDNENEYIEAIIRNKNAGFRRSDPSSQPVIAPVTEITQMQKCNICDFQAKDGVELKIHIDKKHHQCNICSRILKSPVMLREHLRRIHDKEKGTWSNCNICQFSALNEHHLKMHIARHHRELACNKCEFKTRTEGQLKEHIERKHRRKQSLTCRFWLQDSCKKQNCSFLHQRVECKFGNNCRRNNCKFIHIDMQTRNTPQNNPAWINPAFLENSHAYDQNYPFLGKSINQRRIGC